MENEREASWSMVGRNGMQFVLNGSPFYVNGFNAYWLMVLAVDPSARHKISSVLEEAASVGLTVGRIWAFNDGCWRALQISPGVYDEQVFQALDFVISEAKRNKIRLILSLVNNWDAYGGKAQYVTWGRNAGLNLPSNDAFFSDPTLKNHFKSYIKVILNRVNTLTNVAYKNDPTIFAWELINEPRCESDPTGDTLHVWTEEMAAYVKLTDPKHLVGIGMEGFYGPSSPDRIESNPYNCAHQEGTDFIHHHQAAGIDFASIHIYPSNWISDGDCHLSFVKNWTRVHIEDCEKTLKMPLLFSEFGIPKGDGGYRESFMEVVYESVLRSARMGGAAGGSLVWQLMSPEDRDHMGDGFEIVLSQDQSTAKIISEQSANLGAINSIIGCRDLDDMHLNSGLM